MRKEDKVGDDNNNGQGLQGGTFQRKNSLKKGQNSYDWSDAGDAVNFVGTGTKTTLKTTKRHG